MMNKFPQFRDVIAAQSFTPQDAILPDNLELYSDSRITLFYAPFDYTNTSAKIALCGITPGLQQALLALAEAQRQILGGAPDETVLRQAKLAASFGGAMRKNLVRMLDHIQLPDLLGIETSAELFAGQAALAQFTSVLRYPVFVRGKNYNGLPDMLKHPRLREQIETCLLPEVQALPETTVFIPMGSKPAAALHFLAEKNYLDPARVWAGLPHPSGANAERIAFFLGLKPAARLSPQTDPAAILAAKARLLDKINGYRR